MKGIIIKATGSYTPNNIINNEKLGEIVFTNDEWISSRTGIKERKISIDENTSDLAIKSCEKIFEKVNIKREDIDLIIVATCTPDKFIPSTACIVQKALGCVNAMSFDINAACTGFIYGIEVAKCMMKSGNYKNTLVIGAETLSKIIDWKDRNTCVLFGDGAGSILLSKSDDEGIINSFCKSNPEKYECLTANSVKLDNPFIDKDYKEYKTCNENLEKKNLNNNYLQMDGKEVFKFATKIIVESIEKLLIKENIDINEIDYIVPHQANIRIIEHSAKKLGISKEKFYTNLENYGNTSAASIPIALDELNSKNILKKGDKIILVGFGGGLTYGAVLINWSN